MSKKRIAVTEIKTASPKFLQTSQQMIAIVIYLKEKKRKSKPLSS